MTKKEKKKHYDNVMKKRKETQERHSKMICKTFEVKIQENCLSREKLDILKLVFIEGKWFYNDILRSGDISKYDTKNNIVKVYNWETKRYRTKELIYLDSQMKQYLKQQALDSIKGLSILKNHGYKVGQLKFKKECNSLHIKDNKRIKIIDKNNIFIPIFQKIRVNGLEQFIYDNIEIACADLVKKPNGYCVKITTYITKNKNTRNKNKREKINETIGIDFGIKNSYTLSNGKVINTMIPESEILKKLQKKFSRTEKNSKNHSKLKRKIQIEYQKICNRRKDLANKLVSELSRYDKVIIQDELLNNWKGKGISYDSKGYVKSKLKELNNVVVLDSSLPTTQFCSRCGQLNKIPLSQRTYVCNCDRRRKMDRDVHASKNMIWFYDNNIKSFDWSNREKSLKKIQKKID